MAAVTPVGETPAPTAASRPRGMHARRRRRLTIFRYVVFTVFGVVVAAPTAVVAVAIALTLRDGTPRTGFVLGVLLGVAVRVLA